MRMNMPKIWGGPEMTPMEQVEVIAALARADASIAWCSFIWCDSGIYSGYLDDSVAREMYPRLDMATSGWVYPIGRAQREGDGIGCRAIGCSKAAAITATGSCRAASSSTATRR
jgi:hypothetical protein